MTRQELHTKTPELQEPASAEKEPAQARPLIYVASLADYNNGRLHGAWIAADRDEDELWADVSAMLRSSPEPDADEAAIHDFEGFGDFRPHEYDSLATVSTIGRGIGEHGLAFAAWASDVGGKQATETPEAFTDAFMGSWESLRAFAEEAVSDYGWEDELDKLPSSLQPYIDIDFDMLCRDLAIELTVVEHSSGVWIFDHNR